MTAQRRRRTIFQYASGPDKRATDLNNALYVIIEFVSPKRLATLERVPTAAELISAIDLYLTCVSDPELVASARRLRAAAEAWKDGEQVPAAVHDAAKGFISIFTPEPPGGWDEDDGYYHGRAQAGDREALDRAGAQAASVAQPLMHAVNLVGFLARPEQRAERLSREHVLEHVDALLEVAPTFSGGAAALVDAARELRAACASWEDGTSTPPAVQQAARRLLAVMGVQAPDADT